MIKNINDLKIGDILKEPVINNYGQILIAAGKAIEEKHLRLLKIWNIHESIIADEEDNNQFSVALISKAKQELIKRIQWIPENEYEEDLYETALQKYCTDLLKK